MKTRLGLSLALAATLPLAAAAQTAHAQSPRAPEASDEPSRIGNVPLRAPARAFELGVNAGYTQAFGIGVEGAREQVASDTTAGFGFGLDAAYRFTPHVSAGISGGFFELAADGDVAPGTSVRGLTASAGATLHFLPYDRFDPYVGIGTGYRAIWHIPGVGEDNDRLLHGVQLAKVELGGDVRVTDNTAVGPFVGLDVNYLPLLAEETGTDTILLDQPRWATFFNVGLRGRFDVGGDRVHPVDGPARAASR